MSNGVRGVNEGVRVEGESGGRPVDPAEAAWKQILDRLADDDATLLKAELDAPAAKEATRSIREKLGDSASRGPIDPLDIGAGLRALKMAVMRDRFGSPPQKDPEMSRIPAASVQILGANRDGTFKLTTVPGSHLLRDLLKKVGIDANAIPESVKKALGDAQFSRSQPDLSKQDDWTALGAKLRTAALQGSGIKAQGERTAPRRSSSSSRTTPTRLGSPTPLRRVGSDPRGVRGGQRDDRGGLDPRAPLVNGTRTDGTSPMATRLGNMTSEAKTAAKKLATEFASKNPDLTPTEKTQIQEAFEKLLSSPDSSGMAAAQNVLEQSLMQAAKRAPEGSSARDAFEDLVNLAGPMKQMADAIGARMPPQLAKGLLDLAKPAMFAVASAIAGKRIKEPEDADLMPFVGMYQGLQKLLEDDPAFVAQHRKAVAEDYSKSFVKENPGTEAHQKDIAAAFEKVLGKSSAPDGLASGPELLENAFVELAERAKGTEQHGLLEQVAGLARGLREMHDVLPDGPDGSKKMGPDVEHALQGLIFDAMGALASSVAGISTGAPDKALVDKMNDLMLRMLASSAGASTSTDDARETSETAAKASELPPLTGSMFGSPVPPEEARKMAEGMLQGFKPESPEIHERAVKALAGILEKGKAPGSIAENSIRHLMKQGAMPPSFAGHMRNILAAAQSRVDKYSAQKKQLEGDLVELKGLRGKATGTEAKESLEKRIGKTSESLEMVDKQLGHEKGQFQQLADSNLSKVIEHAADPEAFKKKHNPTGAGGPGGTDRSPPLGSQPGGPMGPAFHGGAVDNSAARSSLLSSILADPALSMEDKIFLFMVYFASFMDDDRLKKMDEIVQMEHSLNLNEARRQKLFDQQQDLQPKYAAAERNIATIENKLKDAKDSGDTGLVNKLEGELRQQQDIKAESSGRMAELTYEFDKLKRQDEHDQGSARDIKFAELQRLEQSREKMMQMVLKFLENSSRMIEKINR